MVLFAEGPGGANGGDAKGGGEPGGGLSAMLLPLVAIFVLFYFLLIRPQKREQSRRLEMLAGVKKNDRVLTAGGVYGVVVNIRREADEVTLKVDEATGTKIRVTFGSIARVLGDEPSEASAEK
jgi:preprotein translocase subunit YajC